MKNQILKILLVTFTLLIASNSVFSQSDEFPANVVGIYKGDLQIFSKRGVQKIKMELHIKATKEKEKFNWMIVYIADGKRQERKYSIIKNEEKGEFTIDENNGILLPATFAGGKLTSIYEVQSNLIYSAYTFSKNQMIFEITMVRTANKKQTGGIVEKRILVVTTYPIGVVQKAILKKQPQK